MDWAALDICTPENYEKNFAPRHRLHDVVSYWGARQPDAPALINHNRNETLSWKEFDEGAAFVAQRLIAAGLEPGDYLVTLLPFSVEHVVLAYACFRAGVVHVPLDLRLTPADIARACAAVRASAFVSMMPLPEEMRAALAGVERFWALPPGSALSVWENLPAAAESIREVEEDAGAQVIFTTGSTGSPKPALLSHRNITCQNLCLGTAFDFREGYRVLINLPPSHVGGQAEAMMTTLFFGGTAVLLDFFDAARSMAAIAQHRVNLIGQIPAMFQFEWRLPDYANCDRSSLETILFGGQQVPQPFIERMREMGPILGTGLGLTESGGFCTYTRPTGTPADIEGTLGIPMPIYPMSIREPMREDGSAGAELGAGAIGHVCFKGPQTFLGYVNHPEATARTISTDGWLYTGDLGLVDSRGLKLAGRAKWVIKPAGHQVFPGDVETHIARLDAVAQSGAVGVEHRTLTEAIVAFVEPKPGATLAVEDLRRHGKDLASFMRPLHYVLVEPGKMPLNRTAKVDYIRLSEMARAEIETLRTRGRWDN